MEVELHAFVASALDESEGSAFLPGRITTGGMNTGYPLDRRLVVPQSLSGQDSL